MQEYSTKSSINTSILLKRNCSIYVYIYLYEPFGLGRFATDHPLTKAASRPLFARARRFAPQRDH